MQESFKKVHFIAIGGSVMHNLAIALKNKGIEVSGSDDNIFEPSKSRLEAQGILPEQFGWFPEKITKELDAVIVGMHARVDNPELKKAQELGIKIYSFPEFVYEQSKDKQRVVIAGSHGKTTISAIILHVLKYFNRDFDYVVGAQLEGFENMVKLSDAPLIIIEGDEYLTSPVDPTPKFLHYHHHIGLINGIAWDHANVYPEFEAYTQQFDAFADATPKSGTLIYWEEDDLVNVICKKEREDVKAEPYKIHEHKLDHGKTYLRTKEGDVPVQLIGNHNMQNISGAKAVLNEIGINDEMFYEAIQSFKGASKRLEVLKETTNTIVLRDYAHAPSKVEASTLAVKQQYPEKHLIAVLELHTYSSLSKDFIAQYDNTLEHANLPVIYYNPDAVTLKKLSPLTEQEIREAFGRNDIMLITDKEELERFILSQDYTNKSLLLMSSGNFGGLDLQKITDKIN
jgi:UDP-N-acetylmuramate: L-alanyl-gamma-D-glutamyl-meso-diaminopimelate ligase